MLTIKAEGQAGDNIREDIIPEMIALSLKTGCYVEVKANGTEFRFSHRDSVEAAQDAFDRLYPESRLIMAGMMRPLRKEPVAAKSVDAS